MTKYICFVGVIAEVEAPENIPEQEIASAARAQVFARIQSGEGYAEHDFGVQVVGADND
jgi:hypothetical protein